MFPAPDDMLDLLDRQAKALRRPPATLDELSGGLGRTVPRFEQQARKRLAQR